MTGPGPAPNPRKRGPDTAPSNSTSASAASAAPDTKRARTATARAIVAQTDVAELRTGNLNVAGFVRARKFEIAALQRAMAGARGALKQRAFQSVPRDLRRRTASHNTKRVPSRLRARAQREMLADNTPTHTFRRRAKSGRDRLRAETAAKLLAMGKKRGLVERLIREQAPAAASTTSAAAAAADTAAPPALAKPPRAHSKFRKRQRAKTWLPTHVWHAKRAHMVVRWRFAVAESPTAKSFRSTQRAVHQRGAVAWDTSYWSSILLRGDELLLDRVLEAVCVGGGGGGAVGRVRMGRRAKECWAYARGGSPSEPIAPVMVVWSPAEEAAGDEGTATAAATGTAKGRRVLIRLHPAAFLQVWTELRCVIADHNPAAGPPKVFMDDLRFELGSIRIAGPSATDALLAVLTPVRPAGAAETVWAGLRGLTNPAALPPDVVFGFSVSDPRLRFPPRPLDPSSLPSLPPPQEQQQQQQQQQQQSRLFAIQSTWPMPATPHALLDPTARTAAVKRQASQSRVDKRKAAAAPGRFPEPIENDPEIPVILLSTPLAGHTSSGGGSGQQTTPGAWTVILPWKWVLPVWCALMKLTDVRFGGVAEQRQMAFDHGLPWFPADFAGTPAGDDWEDEQAALRRQTWDRKPRQKRLNYDAVRVSGPGSRGEVGDWSRCDWKILMATAAPPPPPPGDTAHAVPTTSSLLASAPTETQTQTTPPSPPPPPPAERRQWWHMTAALIAGCLRTPHPAALPPPLQAVADSNSNGGHVLQNAIFAVKIVLLQRGSPSAGSRIYRLPAGDGNGDGDGSMAWTALAAALRVGKGRKKHGTKDRTGVVQPGQDAYPVCPGEDHLVGFVTTGNYSLSQGVAVAVGGIAYGAWFRAEPGQPSRASRDRLVIVRGVGETVGRLGRWEVV